MGLPPHGLPSKSATYYSFTAWRDDGTDQVIHGLLRPCSFPPVVCDCHIGYVHLETLPLYDVFAGGVLERIPAAPPALGHVVPTPR